jgi:protein-tyrosine-phosphatase
MDGAGDDADVRMTAAASRRGVLLTSKSRPLRPADLHHFDYIIGMDPSNLGAMEARPSPPCIAPLAHLCGGMCGEVDA